MPDTSGGGDKPRLALLIDADNISKRYLSTILDEIPRHGVATYRRIYGDFTDPQMASWREKLLDNSIMPVQQFSNIKHRKHGERAGKNATDSALIIDAMDILYGGEVDGFVIVSSDSDFTRLATRLRESNMTVVGMGENHTAVSFRHACTKFVNLEALYNLERLGGAAGDAGPGEDGSGSGGAGGAGAGDGSDSGSGDGSDGGSDADTDDVVTTVTLADVASVVRGVIRDNDNKGRLTPLADVGNSLSDKFPDFDLRTFGYSRLSTLIGELEAFSLIRNDTSYYVTLLDTSATTKSVADFLLKAVANAGGQTSIGALATQVYDEYDGFNIKDTGYSQFYKFVNSIDGLKVTGENHQTVVAVQ